MSLGYKISISAGLDLEEIWFFTARSWSVEQADRYYSLLLEEIVYISKHSSAGKPVDHIREGYRVTKVKSHLIFYKINEGVVEVIRILHERMDIESRLLD